MLSRMNTALFAGAADAMTTPFEPEPDLEKDADENEKEGFTSKRGRFAFDEANSNGESSSSSSSVLGGRFDPRDDLGDSRVDTDVVDEV